MKIAFFAFFSLLLLLQGSTSYAQSSNGLDLLDNSEVSLTEPDVADLNISIDEPLIEDTLGLPVMRDQQTITESSQELALDLDDIDSSYGKMMQNFAATLEAHETRVRSNHTTSAPAPKVPTWLNFIVEVISILVVLKIAYQFSDYRFRLQQTLPLSLAVAAVGAALEFTLDFGLFNPARIGLSFIVMLVLMRLITEVHELATVMQMTLIARLVATGMTTIISMGMIVVFGL